MVKVCIIKEDTDRGIETSVNEVISRYSSLTQTLLQEIYLVFNTGILGSYLKNFPNGHLMKQLTTAGFNQKNISYRNMVFGIENFPTADIYFCDPQIPEPEWTPNCLKMAEKLGKDRFYINTNNCYIQEQARQRGLKVLDKNKRLEEIIEEIR